MSDEELIEKLCLLTTSNSKSDERYTDVIYNYIINLQEENKQLKKAISYYKGFIEPLSKENRELRDKLIYYQNEFM